MSAWIPAIDVEPGVLPEREIGLLGPILPGSIIVLRGEGWIPVDDGDGDAWILALVRVLTDAAGHGRFAIVTVPDGASVEILSGGDVVAQIGEAILEHARSIRRVRADTLRADA